ncbi:MAG: hypothetical protein JRI73_00900 [Deltaproteobacteria bacterium]|nr:hypothetical protein [Deltaproteobacteria bacterium]
MISINATLVIQVIHFLILVYILNRLMFRPILKLIDKRDVHVEKTRKGVDRALNKTEVLKESCLSKVHEARVDATQERTDLREAGIAETKKLLGRSKEETAVIRAEMDKEAEKEIEMTRPLMLRNCSGGGLRLNLRINKSVLAKIILLAGVFWFFAPDAEVLAAEELSPGRRLWDNILLFINFGILIFFFIKYARKPLMDYLRGVRKDVESGLNKVETQLSEATSLRDAELDKLKNIQEHIDKVRENILDLGRREKEKHIEEGKIAAENMIQHAKNYAHHRIQEARKVVADEMIDRAFSTVEKVLVKEFSPKDNENIVNQFLNDLKTTKQHLS